MSIPFADQHPLPPDRSFDGGDLDCGNGLLLLIRKHIDPLPPGGLLEIISREISVVEELPAWCRMTSNDLVSCVSEDIEHRFLVCKGPFDAQRLNDSGSQRSSGGRQQTGVAAGSAESLPADAAEKIRQPMPLDQPVREVTIPRSLPAPSSAPAIPPLAVMGIGSWPRPRWMLRAIHEYLQGRLDEQEFQQTADDAVRLVVQRQLAAGVDVVTDGEQRRDSYSSFVGSRLDNCQLVPITDLLPYVDDPEHFADELRALDVPAGDVRHPAVFGPLGRSRPLAVHEYEFARQLTGRPIKVALPGPYLLTRTMWMECISDRSYPDRETLSRDVVCVLREELHYLLAAGVAVVQFDEPVLTEVVFAPPAARRTFMCGALGEKLPVDQELNFARDLFNAMTQGLPADRIGLHICRGNWSRDESVALQGDYRPLMPFLNEVHAGHYFLELCTPRAGELDVLKDLPSGRRIGVGVVNQKLDRAESVEAVRSKVARAIDVFGAERVMLTPDCGFATFADNPITDMEVAEEKLRRIVEVRSHFLGASVPGD